MSVEEFAQCFLQPEHLRTRCPIKVARLEALCCGRQTAEKPVPLEQDYIRSTHVSPDRPEGIDCRRIIEKQLRGTIEDFHGAATIARKKVAAGDGFGGRNPK